MTDDFEPYFRFYPNAYRDGQCFERSFEPCGNCQNVMGWRYIGGVYTAKSTDVAICARCVAAGNLENIFDQDYSFQDTFVSRVDAALEHEILRQTPTVNCFNPFDWPVTDGMPMAYAGTSEYPKLYSIPEVSAAIAAAYAEMGWEDDAGPSPYALIFKQVDGPRFQAVIDLD